MTDGRRKMLAHVVVDIVAIVGFVLLALAGAISGELAAALIAAVQGVYVLQFRKPGPPVGALALVGEALKYLRHG